VYEDQELAMRQMVGHVLATHPEGQSLFNEAGHRRALAEQSATAITQAFTVMQESRLGYEELRHRLDPRSARTFHFGVALTLLTVILAALVVLDAIEFAGILPGRMTLVVAAAAAAAWVGFGWLAALAGRERQHRLLTAIAAGAAAVGFLLAALHSGGAFNGRADPWRRFGVGVLVALLIVALVAVAAVLIARTEPASLVLARHRWHRSRSSYAAAVRTKRLDAEADVVAGQGWRCLIQAHTAASAAGGEQLTTDQLAEARCEMGAKP
jgi:MFS family permease